jgi:hypothetical protein
MSSYTVKKVHEFPTPAGMSLTKLPLGRNTVIQYDVIIPAQGEFGSDIPDGDGKLANLLFTVYMQGKDRYKTIGHGSYPSRVQKKKIKKNLTRA